MSTTNNLNLQLPPDNAIPSEFLTTLNDRMRQIQTAFRTLSAPASTTGTCLQGVHANRVTQNAAKLAPGTQFWEHDRYSIYIVRALGQVGTWAFEAGFYADVYANRPNDLGQADDGFVFYATDTETLYVFNGTTATWSGFSSTITSDTFANRPTGLKASSAGLLFHCTTGTGGVAYNHTFEWSGTGWTVAEREELGGYIRDYAKVPTEPGWQICDGTATHYLDIVAGALTEVAFTTPNLSGVYKKGGGAGSYTGTVNTKGLITLAGNTGAPSVTSSVAAGTGTLDSFASSTHTHSLSTATATLATDPVANLVVLPYFRR